MSYGMRAWDEGGRLTFDAEWPILRQEQVLYIPAWSSGSVDLSTYLGGGAATRFQPANFDFIPDETVMPYTWMVGNTLHWQADQDAVHLTVVGFVR